MLRQHVAALRGIGPRKAEILADELGIVTIEDLIYFKPRCYLDRSSIKPIKDCFVNETVTVIGTIIEKRIVGRNRKFFEVSVSDDTDTLSGVFFGGHRYFDKLFNQGDQVSFSGKISFYKNKQMVHPEFDFLDAASSIQSINTGRIVPMYRSTEKLRGAGFDSRGFRRVISQAIELFSESIKEPLEESVLRRHNLVGLRDALKAVHFPRTMHEIDEARKRIAFNELFFLQYYLALSRRAIVEDIRESGEPMDLGVFNDALKMLPFTLTGDQSRALDEIKDDILSPVPMNRMLQGDVGSGKTVVALLSACVAEARRAQTAFMAPTEILASQHYHTARTVLGDGISMALLTGSTDKEERGRILRGLADGSIRLLIGTHALIQDAVRFKELGLIIIDEQHRFGVQQRGELREKGLRTDLLVMTATPIPRSLSLTLYGDLDLSVIRQKPADRIPVKTLALPLSRIDGVYRSLERYIGQGRQAYYVLPLIEESEKVDLKSATEVYRHLKEKIFPTRRVVLLHGRMKQDEKDRIMDDFNRGDIDILVTTTVIEVGIDVANATVIVIEHAERFGLSQLHQLRGRVGRSSLQSFCVLIYPDETQEESMMRIRVIVENSDGFAIAEEDLKIRGAGEMLGLKQHGRSGGFEFADLARDYELIVAAKKEAFDAASSLGNSRDMLESIRLNPETWMEGMRVTRILSILT